MYELIMHNQIRNLFRMGMGILLLSFVPVLLVGQTSFTQSSGSSVQISGTSTLHAWDMKSQQVVSKAVFEMNSQDQLVELTSLSFSLDAKSLKSDNRRLDNNAYDALETDKYEKITFQAATATVSPGGTGQKVKVTGKLQIAGVTKDKTIEATCTLQSDKSIRCTGETKLKMSEFGVKPPSFMLGAMKTGDEITISYDIIYKK